MSVANALKEGIFVVAAKRTPFGAFGGSLKAFSPTDLQALASAAALKAGNINPEIVDSVHIGNVLASAGPDTPYISRHVSLKVGLRTEIPALTVNRYLTITKSLFKKTRITIFQTLWFRISIYNQWCSRHCRR